MIYLYPIVKIAELVFLQTSGEPTLSELFSALASLGVGGIIAIIVLRWKRSDDEKSQQRLDDFRKQSDSDYKDIIERLTALHLRSSDQQDKILEVLQAYTASITSLTDSVRALSEDFFRITERLGDDEQIRRSSRESKDRLPKI